VHSYLERVQQAVETAISDMTTDELLRHPEGKWCAAEILEHLARAFGTTVTHLQKCLDAGRPSASVPTLKQWLTSTVVVDLGYFPAGRKAPDFTRPKGLPPDEVVRGIRENLQAMDAVIAECERRFGTRGKLANHPILGPLSVAQWRRFHWVHTRHHMKQIELLKIRSQ
jgi:hypothetical protein